MIFKISTIFLAFFSLNVSAQISPIFQVDELSKIVSDCKVNGEAEKDNFAVVLLDQTGSIVYAHRPSNQLPLILEIALVKAKTSNNFRTPTSEMTSVLKMGIGLQEATGSIDIPGGIPIRGKRSRLHVGAIGVSGASPSDDEFCAKAIARYVSRGS